MNAATLSGPDTERSMTPAMRASRLLGWVSFAIGAAELLAPRKVARAVGMNEERTGLLRAYGAREMLAGVGSHSVYPVPALWSRVAGDVLDIATVALAADKNEQGRRNRNNWIAMGLLTGITVIDALVASRMAAETKEGKGETRDYSDRSGFPKGVSAARGAGIVRDAFGGKAGGAAAGDVSAAGQTDSGRTTTDLAGAPPGAKSASPSGAASTIAPQGTGSGSSGGGSTGPSGGFIGGGQTMPGDAQQAIPRPVGYTPV
jgi:hypothetical protein